MPVVVAADVLALVLTPIVLAIWLVIIAALFRLATRSASRPRR